ncbi:FecR family protein [Chondrinema litorale]|uniref:FecR family protein n=1 Tax=Chondrinema litorale TaxID=2994555 RepID=UPI0025446BF9|nr:FecR family protein [Chondrinema litorale]UZR95285.1 FecR domain-containing protein [Chondrinema litorale]
MNQTEAFLNDPKFWLWVKSPDKELDDYWQSWCEQHPDKIKELQEARAFLSTIEFKQFTASETEKQSDWAKIKAGTQSQTTTFYRFTNFYRIAAIITLILISIVSAYLFFEQLNVEKAPVVTMEQRATNAGQKISLKLTDGTYIKLNSGSKLIYPSQFSDTARIVKLIGEAYFEVAKDAKRPFLVEAGNITTKVLGTRFNVNGYSENVSVSLIEGSVEVSNETDGKTTRQLIVPGEKARWTNNEFTIEKLNKLEIGWKDNILYFQKSSISEIKNVLEKWYGVTIHIDQPEKIMKSFNGEFQDESLDNVLESMGFAMKFNYRIEDKHVYINPNENE